jgi:hypothetical protein
MPIRAAITADTVAGSAAPVIRKAASIGLYQRVTLHPK